MKKISFLFLILICFMTPLFITGCKNEDDYKLPSHYYNLNSKYIAYTYNDSVYNKNTKHFLAKFDYDKKIFIDKYGKYYGEIIEENILIYDSNSIYVSTQFQIPKYEEIGNIPSIAKIRGFIAFQPINIVDVELYN